MVKYYKMKLKFTDSVTLLKNLLCRYEKKRTRGRRHLNIFGSQIFSEAENAFAGVFEFQTRWLTTHLAKTIWLHSPVTGSTVYTVRTSTYVRTGVQVLKRK